MSEELRAVREGSAVADDARVYPCDRCGVMRSKKEGGTVFSVCDECWAILYPSEAPRLPPTPDDVAFWYALSATVLGAMETWTSGTNATEIAAARTAGFEAARELNERLAAFVPALSPEQRST